MLAIAATVGVSMLCSPAYAQALHHPIVRGWTCTNYPADVRWINSDGALWLQVHLNGETDEEGGFYFDLTGVKVTTLTFTAYFGPNFDNNDFYWYAYDKNDDYVDGDFTYVQIPGHPGFYNVSTGNVASYFSQGAVIDDLEVEVYGDEVGTANFTHWAIGGVAATTDVHVWDKSCGSG